MNTIKMIDVHHHFLPEEYRSVLRCKNKIDLIDADWTIKSSLAKMDKANIHKAYLSLPFSIADEHPTREKETIRKCNEAAAAIVQNYPDRFGAFAALPFLDVENCLKEIEYSLDILKLDGIIIHTNYNGELPSSSALDMLYSELDSRTAVIFIHPDVPTQKTISSSPAYINSTEYFFDLARFVTALMYNGIFEKYTNIKYIMANGGGIVPYFAQRIGRTFYLNGEKLRWRKIISDMRLKKDSSLELLKSFYYETSSVLEPAFITALKSMVGSSRILYGSNYGENLRTDISISVPDLIENGLFSAPEAEEIFYNNTNNLLG